MVSQATYEDCLTAFTHRLLTGGSLPGTHYAHCKACACIQFDKRDLRGENA